MKKVFDKWRYYSIGHIEYRKCMDRSFSDNVHRLFLANRIVAILALMFTVFPFFISKNYFNALFYIGTSIIAAFFTVYTYNLYKQQKQGKIFKGWFIYFLITLYYINVVVFGIYLGVWANPENFAVSFMCILICALFLFNASPVFLLSLTLSAMTVFMVITILVKPIDCSSMDVTNSLFAGLLSLYFGWQITKHRITSALTINELENERNNYFDQSTIDELTQLKNRRDFMQTFQRFSDNYRQSDNFLCLAIMDIDFFKNYNDHYGHPKGDECLRSIGKAFLSLKESMNIYISRIGGEEFAMLWFEKDADNAKEVASKVNQLVRDLNIKHEFSDAAPRVTVSIGVHISPCGAIHDNQVLYNLADKALYTAKSNGRDRAFVQLSVHDDNMVPRNIDYNMTSNVA
ncbi:MAG: GGDEF domain-containing protein [Treponema sp.]|nr:GGDEF domain-containing protein [Treponema sp.]